MDTPRRPDPPRRLGLAAALLAAAALACNTLLPQPTAAPPATQTRAAPATRAPEATSSLASTPDPTLAAPAETQPADAQTGAPGIGDPYFPEMGNGGYDVVHYTLDLEVDMARRRLTGLATIQATAIHTLERFNLDFVGLQIEEVLVDGEPASFEREAGELSVTPAHAIPAGAAFSVRVAYSGAPGERLPRDVQSYNVSWNFYREGVLVAGEPSGAAGWYPLNEHPLDKSTYTFRITVAEPYVAAANGLLAETRDNGDTRTYTWEARDPAASYLTTVAIGDFVTRTAVSAGGVPIRSYFAAELPASTIGDFDLLPEMIDYFETRFGPYPFEVYGVVVHDLDLRFALETQTLALFGRSFTTERVVAHELAHQWFGNSVSLAAWQHIWLNEGFASYAETLWIEHTDGPGAAERNVREIYASLAVEDPDFAMTRAELADTVAALPLDSAGLSREAAREALSILLSPALGPGEIDALVGEAPEQGLDAEALASLISRAPFSEVTLRRSQFDAFLGAVRLESLVREASTLVIGDPGPQNLFNGVVYQRGALTLHALRLKIGDDAFFAALQTYASRFANGNAQTQDFVDVAEQASGQDLDAFFESWLFTAELPDIPELGLLRSDFNP